MKYVFATLILTMFLAGTAFAKADYDICFTALSSNGEVVTKADLDREFPGEGADILKVADTDQSGSLDHDEWEAFKASKGIADHH